MPFFRCSGCAAVNLAVNDLAGIRHMATGGKDSRCTGRYQPFTAEDDSQQAHLDRFRTALLSSTASRRRSQKSTPPSTSAAALPTQPRLFGGGPADTETEP